MLPFFGPAFGNPSSVHHVGRIARAGLDDARERISAALRCKPSEIVFTSGGTESVNLAVFGVARLLRQKGRHIITSAVEHHAVLHCCKYLEEREGFRITYLPVNSEGVVSVDCLEKAISPDTILVSIMAANNETGTIQPITALGAVCQSRGIIFHTDAVQWFGKEPVSSIHQFNASLVSICAHKFYGPKGAGALFIKSPLVLDPILFGGSHELERRAGTENLAGIIGLAYAVERFLNPPIFPKEMLTSLTGHLAFSLSSLPGVLRLGSSSQRLSNTLAVSIAGCDSFSLVAALDLEQICVSSGAACSSGSLEPSHVLAAMGLPRETTNSLIRFSLGRESTLEEVKTIISALPQIIRRVKEASKVSSNL